GCRRRDAPSSAKARSSLRTFWNSRRRTYVLPMGYSACPAPICASMFSRWRRRRAIPRNCLRAWSRGSIRRITAYRRLRPSPTAATSSRSRSIPIPAPSPTTRSFGFTPYELPVAMCRATGDHEYQVLKGALTRLRSTLIRITVRYGAHRRCQQFSWINEWEELCSGRCQSIEFVVPASSYQGVLDPLLVPRSRGEKRQSGTAHRQGRQ